MRNDPALAVGLALTAIWLLLVALFWLFGPEGSGEASGLARLGQFVAVLMPVALIWLATGLARAIALLRAEADELRGKLAQIRGASGVAAVAQHPTREAAPAAAPRPVAPIAAEKPAPSAKPRPTPADGRQAAMRFDAPESVAVDPDMLIRALNFPDGPDDAQAISALRTALKDHDNSRVIRAAQDVITLLADHDMYMDNLDAQPATPAMWRRFSDGVRGQAIDAVGGVHDQNALEIATHMLKSDEIFRDAAHHFLRHFDILLTRMIPQLDDDGLARLADTRSARAFMLLGRVTGIFG